MGLARSIRNLIWFENEDIDEFYPRCYDLNDVGDFDDFMEDFKFEQAIGILRLAQDRKPEESSPSYNILKLKICLALSACEKRLKPIEMIVTDLVRDFLNERKLTD